ncbi:MAG: nucleotidyl transferase AbiEii/AbiGii toxin family protein [Peptococcaceae bacterium]|nr:nucleotidyl transferase AbiEii/AbiGii toxin family protein [Peptococcaceae bacterium]
MELLARHGILQNFYLAGGTAAALYLGHRISEDFDFFSRDDFNTFDLIQRLSELGSFALSREDHGTVHGLLNGVKLSFLLYKYPLLYPTESFMGCQLADLRDIALMKITAISSRGSKKDFIDLYFITQEIIDLKSLMGLFEKKYKRVAYSKYHLIRSIGYFEDAEREVNPLMLKPVKWEDVKEYFLRQQRELMQTL